jgi:CheY-like chemotaxis protein
MPKVFPGALEFIHEHEFDLLITDQAMPNMTGTQLAEQALQVQPSLSIVLATGYGELPTGSPQRIVKLGKPFDSGMLAKALAAAMA